MVKLYFLLVVFLSLFIFGFFVDGGPQDASVGDSDLIRLLDGEPQTLSEVSAAVVQARDYARAKDWWKASSLIILIFVFLLKAFGVFRIIGKRWIYILVPFLGLLSYLLAGFAGGVSWDSAWLVLTSAPCAALLNDFFKRGIMAFPFETPLKSKN